ncbi:3'-5' exonuclease [Populibacterium corticicola]|uniref:DNA 3'-5' helicase n=1 Tax=Populibacterium corticicola TaxID=1812826 RepID=A0ABW5XBZ8_9MICO
MNMQPMVQLDKDWLTGIDASNHKIAKDFLGKLLSDPTAPGLHVEPMKNPMDSRVRTARVNDSLRAILFKVTSGDAIFFYVYRVYTHDKANSIAPKTTFGVNSVTGVPEFAQIDKTVTELPGVGSVSAGSGAGGAGTSVPDAPPFLGAWGSTAELLVEQLGFAADTAALAMKCTSDDEIIDLAALISGVHSEMLLTLATGKPISEVRIEYGLDEAKKFITQLEEESETGTVDLTSDEVIVEATKRALAKAQFKLIDGQKELQEILEQGDFGAWRTFLHPTQRRYVETDYNGSGRLSGGAGTGKTVVLLHRAARLARANPSAQIVLTTFNKTLAQNLRENLAVLDGSLEVHEKLGAPGVYVRGVDALAAAILKNADSAKLNEVAQGLLGRNYTTATQFQSDNTWQIAADGMPEGTDPRVANPTFLKAEYENVILPRGITSQGEYRSVRRPGRGVALNRNGRDNLWGAIQAYKANSGENLSFPERVALATAYLRLGSAASGVAGSGVAGAGTAGGAAAMESGTAGTGVAVGAGVGVVDHILVDEGQDFSAVHWALIRALAVPSANDIYIAEDANQRIYAPKIVLSHHGINIVGRSRRLNLNYRTTQENLTYALGVLEGGEYEDLEGGAVETGQIISARKGPVPQMFKESHLGAAVEKVASIIGQWRLDDGEKLASIAVLLPKKNLADKLETTLATHGIDAKYIDNNAETDPSVVQLMTMHRSKGMEFSRVILFRQGESLSAQALMSKGLSPEEEKEQLLRNRSLVYVASTRARDELVIVE